MQTLRNIHASRQGGGNRSGSDASNTLTTKEAFTSGTKIRSGDDCQVHDLSPHEGQHYEYNLKPEGNIRIRPAAGHRIAIKEQDNQTTGADNVGVITCQRGSKNGIIEDLEVLGNVKERDERLVKTHVPNFSSTANYSKGNQVKFNTRIWEYINNTANIKVNPGSDATVWKEIERICHIVTGAVLDGVDNKMDCIWVINQAGVGFLAGNFGTRGELNGCISAMNGNIDQDGKGRGHGFYIQNSGNSGWRKDYNSTAFFNMRLGVQYYGTNPIKQLDIRGFWGFLNAAINPQGWVEQNILIGSTKEDEDIIFYDGIGYELHKRNMQYGWQSKIFGIDAKDGYWWGGTTVVTHMRTYTSSFINETVVESAKTDLLRYIFVESWADFQAHTFDYNTYYADRFRIQIQFRNGERPSQIFTSLAAWQQYSGKDLNSVHLPLSAHPNSVRFRIIKPGIVKIALINPERIDFMAVNLSGYGLTHGQSYEVRDMQNLLNDYVLKFTYNSASPTIYLPTTMTEVMQIYGRGPKQPVHTDKEFNSLLLFPEGWRNLPHHNGTSAPVYQEPITHVNAPLLSGIAASGYNISFDIYNRAANASSLLIFRSVDEINFTQIYEADPGETSYTDTSLAPATTYFYKAVAKAANEVLSQDSNVISVTTEAAPLALPVVSRVAIVTYMGIEVRNLQSNDTIDIDYFGTNFSFEAFANEYTESVEFKIGDFRHIENNARWAAFGNTGDSFKTWMEMSLQNNKLADPLEGSPHVMEVTAWSAKNATGTASITEVFNINITKAAPNEPPVIFAVGDQVIEEGETLQLEMLVQDEDPANLAFYFELQENSIIENITFSTPQTVPGSNPMQATMVATITTKPGMTGTETVRIYATDNVNSPGYLEFLFTVEPVFVDVIPPTLPFFPNIIMGTNSTQFINFEVQDGDTPIEQVTTEVKSENENVIKPQNISITGTGNIRTLMIRTTGVRGNSLITITASDGVQKRTESFTVEVRAGKNKGFSAVIKVMG